MDVAARAQRIDWKASKKEFSKYQQRPDGKKFIFVDSNDRFDGYVFKCDPTAEIKIWRENDVEDDNYIWSTSKGNIFVSDDLGARLKREFPGCLALLQIKEMQA